MYRIGIDLGGTNIAIGIVTDEGKLVKKKSVPTLAKERTGEEIVEVMVKESLSLIKEEGLKENDIRSIGIGSPGVTDPANGVLVHTVNLPFLHTPFRKIFEKYTKIPMYLNNDANCAALGEIVSGGAAGYKNCVMITLGTGVGGGIIVDGKIVTGFNGAAGEVGHMVIHAGGELCNCGRRGCYERYASATALIQFTRAAAEKHPESIINKLCEGDLNKISAKTPFEAKRAGDLVAAEIIENYIHDLGDGILNFMSIFQPEVILVGGGVSYEGDYLFNPLREYVIKNAFATEYIPQAKILPATLGNDAGIIGAAMLDE
ncbi:MAG: ROK family glucokinase [Ruminococcaceae bacterium]|nr:ROK family glucokinase [Oscillospiraceae bacterium]